MRRLTNLNLKGPFFTTVSAELDSDRTSLDLSYFGSDKRTWKGRTGHQTSGLVGTVGDKKLVLRKMDY